MARSSLRASSLIIALQYFAFLAGTGAFLSTRRGKSIQQVSRFFFTRGLWLVLLELTIVDFAWGFVPWAQAWSDLDFRLEHGGDGADRVASAAVDRGPGIGHDRHSQSCSMPSIQLRSASFTGCGYFSTRPAVFRSPIIFSFSVRYVLIPWVGVMATGFAFGRLLLRPDRRKWILTHRDLRDGAVLRAPWDSIFTEMVSPACQFGYPRSAGPWSVQPTLSLTVISFFNVLKYPPSLDYLLMTLGPALIVLGLLDRAKAERGLSRILLVYGRVPLFYYVLHIYLLNMHGDRLACAGSFTSLPGTAPSSQTLRSDRSGMVTVCLSFTPCGFWPWRFSICRAGGLWNSAAGIGIGLG